MENFIFWAVILTPFLSFDFDYLYCLIFNSIMPNIHRMVKHALKILQHLLQDFHRVFNHFLGTKHDRGKLPLCLFEVKCIKK